MSRSFMEKHILSTLTGETPLVPTDILTIFLVTLILGGYIFWIYRRQARAEFYSKDFNIILPALSIVTSGIMVAMQANLLVSLGMVGSLSIIRFRTAVKSPKDLLYLFWAISIGIISGVGLYSLAFLLCVFVTLILFGFKYIYDVKQTTLLIIKTSEKTKMQEMEDVINKLSTNTQLSSMVKRNEETEYIYEVMISDLDSLKDNLNQIEGIKSINIISNTGERRF